MANIVTAATLAMDDNPFFLHQNENPAAVLVSAVLSEGGLFLVQINDDVAGNEK